MFLLASNNKQDHLRMNVAPVIKQYQKSLIISLSPGKTPKMPPLPSSLQSSGAKLRSQQKPPPTLELLSQPGRSASDLGVSPRTLLAPLLERARPGTTCPGATKCLLSTSLYECRPLIQSFVSRSGKGTAA